MKYLPVCIFLILVIVATGALGGAAYTCSMFRISQFEIEVDADTLRARPLIDLLDTFNGRLFIGVTTQELQNDISTFKQVERVTITRMGFTGFRVKIALRYPLLVVTNGLEKTCLGPGGIPFPYWPEYGNLPVFVIPEHITQHQMLNPDSSTSDFYFVALQLVSQPLEQLSLFSTFSKSTEFEIQLTDQLNSRLLRLPRTHLRNPVSSLVSTNNWLEKNKQINPFQELDARFPNVLLLKPIKKGSERG
ncbi:hypothetical protein K8T06_02975 [bacterium]|nr:hypothetical protein [bacterium]